MNILRWTLARRKCPRSSKSWRECPG